MAKIRSVAGLLAGCSLAALVQGLGARAEAQTLPAPPTAPTTHNAADSSSQLEAIVVTARRRQENIVTTPVAISAISAQSLEARNITDLTQLSAFAPGFHQPNINFGRNDRGYQSYTMRGIYGGDGQQRQPVRLFIDGVPISSGMIAGLDAIDRVEVIKGPQSAYFGRSTFGGAINFIIRTPTSTPHYGASADFGSYGYQELKASVEGPIIKDVLAGRLSARYYNSDGEYKNAFDGGRMGARKTKSIAGTLSFTPMSNLRVKAFGQYWQDEDGPSAQGLFTAAERNCNPAGGPVPTYICGAIKSVPARTIYWNTGYNQAIIDAITAKRAATNVDYELVHHIGLGRRAYQAFTSFEYDLPARWMLSGNIGGDDNQYRVVLDNIQQPSTQTFLAASVNRMSDFSGELRLQSPTYFDRVRGMVGVNYLDASVNGKALGYRGPSNLASQAAANALLINAADYTKYYSRTTGLFASLHFDLTDKLKLDLEGRQQADNVTQKISLDSYSLPTSLPVRAEKTFYTFTPKVSLSYFIEPDVMVYASYAAGSRPGQFNAALFSLPPANRAALLSQAVVNLAAPPEKLDMYEAGFKGEFLDHRGRILLSAYYGLWYRRQVTSPVIYIPPGAPTFVLVNVITGSSNVNLYGVEAEGSFRVNSNLTVEGTFAYNESDIGRSFCAACAAITGNGNQVGNRLPGYAAVSGTASLTYTRDFSGGTEGFARVDYIYTGKQYDQELNLAYTPAGSTVNVRFGARRNQYSVEVYGRNIFDDKTPTSVFTQSNLAQGGFGIIATPPQRAAVGLRLSVNY